MLRLEWGFKTLLGNDMIRMMVRQIDRIFKGLIYDVACLLPWEMERILLNILIINIVIFK